jgi:hypothetical protein
LPDADTARLIHPVPNLDGPVALATVERRLPARLDFDPTDRAVVRIALFRAIRALLPRRPNPADEIDAAVIFGRQVDGDLAGAQVQNSRHETSFHDLKRIGSALTG